MIRKISIQDESSVAEMMRDFYSSDAVLAPIPEEYFSRTIKHCLNDDTYAELFIYEEEDKGILGYVLTAKTWSNEAGGMVTWIEELYVKPGMRGKGIGHKLLKHILLDGSVRYRLEIEEENTGAIKLYKSYGFKFFEYDQMILEEEK